MRVFSSATSGSPGSDVAVEYGLTLAWLQELEFCLLHVNGPRSDTEADPETATAQLLLTHTETQAAALGIGYNGVHTAGNIVKTIVSTARRNQCDVVVMGSHGTTGWKRQMVGSIAHAVAAKAALPVLLVKRSVRL